MVDGVTPVQQVQVLPQRGEVLGALRAQVVEDVRRAGDDRLAPVGFAIEHTQRIRLAAPLAVAAPETAARRS